MTIKKKSATMIKPDGEYGDTVKGDGEYYET